MMLSEDDFYVHKPKTVDEVLSKLRHLARMEAELLFREFEKQPDALPAISQRISNAINLATDAICKKLDDTAAEEVETLLPLFKDHLPKTISDLAFDEVHNRVPHQYICN
eukprot:813539_1